MEVSHAWRGPFVTGTHSAILFRPTKGGVPLPKDTHTHTHIAMDAEAARKIHSFKVHPYLGLPLLANTIPQPLTDHTCSRMI